jgi:hypothetical protein
MSGRWVAVAATVALAALPALAGCGAEKAPKAKPVEQSVTQCQQQWHDVAESVIGLDEETDPSALASRWTTVIATVDYYENSTESADCQANVETQVRAITALRQFSEKLRRYDMTFQLNRVSAGVDLYLHDPVPAPGRDAAGKLVKAPTHHQVSEALAVLTVEAAEANAELQPGWAQLASVSLDDAQATDAAIADLDALAQVGEHWSNCQEALQVIVAAIRAQEGLLGTPEDQSSSSPSPTPSGSPTASPTS